MDVSSAAIDGFIDQLITQKFAGQELDEAAKNDIKRELTDRLNQYLTLRTIEMISDTNPDAVTKLSDLIKTNPSPEDVQKFISQYVTEPDVLVAQIFADFQNLYLGIQPAQSN